MTAFSEAHRNGDGVPADSRTNAPLRAENAIGGSGFEVRYHPETGSYFAQNLGDGFGDTIRPAPYVPEWDTAGIGAPMQMDPSRAALYSSGDASHPGDHPPHTPPDQIRAGVDRPGYTHMRRPEGSVPYQEQVSGLLRADDGRVSEYVRENPTTGRDVKYDGHTYRGDPPDVQEVFLEAKDGYADFYFNPNRGDIIARAGDFVADTRRQVEALSEGAVLEIHVSDPYGARALEFLVDDTGFANVEVVYTPKI